jgi:hypothetical protein
MNISERLQQVIIFNNLRASTMKAALIRLGLGGIGVILFSICLFLAPVSAGNDCQPHTWGPGPKRDLGGAVQSGLVESDDSVPQAGDLNCRKHSPTYDDANYYTCTELAEKNRITIEEFFWLNPGLKKDCSNIQPNSEYCVVGCRFLAANANQFAQRRC